MAKVLFTAAVADIRGKLAGTVFSKNRAGAFIRTKVTPTNRQTPAQAAARATLSQFSAGWRALTQAQRASWQAASSAVDGTDVFGNAKTISGQQMYVGVNSNLKQLGVAAVANAPQSRAPVYTGTAFLTSSVVGGEMFAFTLNLAGTAGTDTRFAVSATEPLSTGIYNADGKYRSLGILGVPGSNLQIDNAYRAKFGGAAEGAKIFVRLTPISLSSGQASADIILSLIMGGSSSFSSFAKVGGENVEVELTEAGELAVKPTKKNSRKASESDPE